MVFPSSVILKVSGLFMDAAKGQIVIAALLPHAPILIPCVGGERCEDARASMQAMSDLSRRVVASQPECLVLISPHSPRRRGAFAIWAGERLTGSLRQFGAPEAAIDLPADETISQLIMKEARARGVAMWWLYDQELDHGATVPLWYLTQAGWAGPTVVLGLNYPGEPGLLELGQAIAAAAHHISFRLAVIASGDMSHRLKPGAPAGFHPRARDFDHQFIGHLRSGNFHQLEHPDSELQEIAAEDVADSTLVAASAANWDAAGHQVLSYEGPFGVGYGVAILHCRTPGRGQNHRAAASASSPRRESTAHHLGLPQIARASIAASFRVEPENLPAPAPGLPSESHGVFVTIRGNHGRLRGCIGTLSPQFRNLVEETWHVARDAAFHDHRFNAVTASELKHLRFEVSVVFPPEEIASPADLDPRHYGLIVGTADGRRGVLLPDVQGVETVEQQIAICRSKGGIDESEPVRLQRFVVKKFSDSNQD